MNFGPQAQQPTSDVALTSKLRRVTRGIPGSLLFDQWRPPATITHQARQEIDALRHFEQAAAAFRASLGPQRVMSVDSAIFVRSPLTPQLRTLSRQATALTTSTVLLVAVVSAANAGTGRPS